MRRRIVAVCVAGVVLLVIVMRSRRGRGAVVKVGRGEAVRLTDLPADAVKEILTFLDARDVGAVARLNSSFCEAVGDDAVWKVIFESKFGPFNPADQTFTPSATGAHKRRSGHRQYWILSLVMLQPRIPARPSDSSPRARTPEPGIGSLSLWKGRYRARVQGYNEPMLAFIEGEENALCAMDYPVHLSRGMQACLQGHKKGSDLTGTQRLFLQRSVRFVARLRFVVMLLLFITRMGEELVRLTVSKAFPSLSTLVLKPLVLDPVTAQPVRFASILASHKHLWIFLAFSGVFFKDVERATARTGGRFFSSTTVYSTLSLLLSELATYSCIRRRDYIGYVSATSPQSKALHAFLFVYFCSFGRSLFISNARALWCLPAAFQCLRSYFVSTHFQIAKTVASIGTCGLSNEVMDKIESPMLKNIAVLHFLPFRQFVLTSVLTRLMLSAFHQAATQVCFRDVKLFQKGDVFDLLVGFVININSSYVAFAHGSLKGLAFHIVAHLISLLIAALPPHKPFKDIVEAQLRLP
ncbi:hypothetical protein DIPPA_27596 [Diplonema papillatum]|nr:hypothetical protein DIPPA_27596 [Diplonema papillatum]